MVPDDAVYDPAVVGVGLERGWEVPVVGAD